MRKGYFSAISGDITDEVNNEYINKHTDAHQPYYVLLVQKIGVALATYPTPSATYNLSAFVAPIVVDFCVEMLAFFLS